MQHHQEITLAVFKLARAIKVIAGETKVFKEGIVKKPDISLSMDSDTFLKLLNKELTGFDGLAQGKVKVTGNVGDLLLIEKHLI